MLDVLVTALSLLLCFALLCLYFIPLTSSVHSALTAISERFTTFIYVCTVALQCELGEGSSVLFHKDWRFYEFNIFRAEGFPERRALGLYNTVQALYTKAVDDENLLT